MLLIAEVLCTRISSNFGGAVKSLLLLLFFVIPLCSDTLDVALYNFPPCVILKKGQDPTGFDVEVFEKVCKNAGLHIRYTILDKFPDLLTGVEEEKYDGAVAAITITGDRENRVDFAHPYLNSGLSIMINKDAKVNPFRTALRYVSNTGSMLLLIILFTAFYGILVFFLEKWFARKKSMFSPNEPVKGIFNGYYYANVSTTTMGFGDFVTKSVPGKLLTVLMAYIGIYFILPYATANMNMALQQEQEVYDISNPEDLPGKIIATEKGTTSEWYLKNIGCNVRTFANINEAYEQLDHKKVDAVVFDMPTIKYLVNNKGKNKFRTSGPMFDRQVYGFALTKGSPYREAINEHLADFMRTPSYWDLHKKWFGYK